MREIKFRIWDKQDLKYFAPTYDPHRGNLTDLSISLSGRLLMRTLTEPAIDESVFPDRFHTPEQYTGLKDKRGTEIYEGDIVEFEKDRSLMVVECGIQRVDAFEGVGYNLWDFYGNPDDEVLAIRLQESIRVVGNIHQNPGILEIPSDDDDLDETDDCP